MKYKNLNLTFFKNNSWFRLNNINRNTGRKGITSLIPPAIRPLILKREPIEYDNLH